ncbi:Alpha/Beta hydrolase protein [Lasiosphaeris hirsuta]|uniref:Alpha/Beta hydrolase protein n=1 Tax=Lasiosphaeris hirsuta TaxID=260670 RepID=A0AA40AP52_9PEZI|nr:Alpha/Beta hydrolase protein [Lasiosphaeris hirsuta]
MLLIITRTLRTWFAPTLSALLSPSLPFSLRWRLLLLQPLNLIAYSIQSLPYLFTRPFTAEYLTLPNRITLRILVFHPARNPSGKPRPLHLDIHGGSFLGGLPETNAPFCARLARETGALVIATTYRFAPVHPFPAAIDDVDAVLAHLRRHAADKYGADPDLITVSGDSAGGNLALATTRSLPAGAVKASVTFYASINLELSPGEKPGLEGGDPLRVIPYFARLEDLPRRMLLVVPKVDILVREQLEFAERLSGEIERDREGRYEGRRVEVLFVERGFHGYLGLPATVVGQELKDQAWDAGVKFIQDAHRQSGWHWPRSI